MLIPSSFYHAVTKTKTVKGIRTWKFRTKHMIALVILVHVEVTINTNKNAPHIKHIEPNGNKT